MGLIDAVIAAGSIPAEDAARAEKKRYSEMLSNYLANEVAAGLRAVGFSNVKPLMGGPKEKEFQGGLGPKKVDVSYSDDRHGLLLAVSIKSISFAPYGKNLKNRFGDLCTEAITLHMRFPYSVVCALFVFPHGADRDVTVGRPLSTFRRAAKLLSTIAERDEHTDPGEKFENIALLLFEPCSVTGPQPCLKLIDSSTQRDMSEEEYFLGLRDLYNRRNPHAIVGEEDIAD